MLDCKRVIFGGIPAAGLRCDTGVLWFLVGVCVRKNCLSALLSMSFDEKSMGKINANMREKTKNVRFSCFEPCEIEQTLQYL